MQLLHLVFTLPCIIFIYSCANPVTPSGGKKDTIPPKVLSSIPDTNSVNFTGKKIVLNMSEYVQLDNPFQKVVISPPLEQFPDITLKGKSVVIAFKEALKPNTTYSINIADAIKDITEGNVMKGYSFVFSTGPKLDSLKISGLVLDAEKSQTMEDAVVMLYKDLSDSVVYKHKPYYFARTDKAGKFTIEHIQDGTYKLFALKDANFNLIYDQLSEPVAFSDTPIVIKADTSNPVKDSALSVTGPKDSLSMPAKDTLALTKDTTKKSIAKVSYRLNMFTPQNPKLILSDAISNTPEKNQYNYTGKVNKLTVTQLDTARGMTGNLFEWNPTKDTITQWVTFSAINPKLRIVANDTVIDTVSLKRPQFTPDSIKPKSKLTWANPFKTTLGDLTQSLYTPIKFDFNRPVDCIDTSKVQLYTDTTWKNQVPVDFIFSDSAHRKLGIATKWTEEAWYSLYLQKGAFEDIYGKLSDSVRYQFRVLNKEDYGTIVIVLEHPDSAIQYIVTFSNNDGSFTNTHIVSGADSIPMEYKHLDPGSYSLKIIIDKNRNGQWDNGSYPDKRQPEKVYMHPSAITIRPNWDIRQEIEMK